MEMAPDWPPVEQTQDPPWLQIPWPGTGQPEKLHTRPQPPQLLVSVVVFTHRLLHWVGVGGRQPTHTPPVQISLPSQRLLQEPQLRRSV